MAYGKGSNNSGVTGGLKGHWNGARIRRQMNKRAGKHCGQGKRK